MNGENFLKHLMAGALSNFTTPKDVEGWQGYLPGSVTGLYSLGDLLRPSLGVSLPGSQRAGELAQASQETAQDLVNVGDPQNTGDTVASVLGSLLVPGPKLDKFGKVVQVVGEIALPLRQTKALPALGIGLGQSAAIDVAKDMTDPNYQGLISSASAMTQPEPAVDLRDYEPVSGPQDVATPTGLQPAQIDLSNYEPVPMDLSGYQPMTQGDIMLSNVKQRMLERGQQLQEQGLLMPLTVAGAVAGGVAGARLLSRNLDQAAEASRLAALQDRTLTGSEPPDIPATKSATGDVTASLQGVTQDRNALAHAMIDRMGLMPDDAASLKHDVNRASNAAQLNEQLTAALTDGVLPDGHRIEPLANLRNDMMRLPPDKQQLFNDALWAGTELDNRTRNMASKGLSANDPAARSMFPDVPTYGLNGTHNLRDIYNSAYADPDVAPLLGRMHTVMSQGLDYMVRAGIFSNVEAGRMRAANKNYMSAAFHKVGSDDPFVKRMLGETSVTRQISATDAAELYLRSAFDIAAKNEARKQFLQQVQGYNIGNPASKFEAIGKTVAKPIPGKTISYYVNGAPRHVEVENGGLRALLEFNPEVAAGMQVGEAFRRFMQYFTTGPGALLGGAFQAPITMMYNQGSMMVQRPRGYAIGYIDRAMQDMSKKLIGRRIGLPGDPSSYAATGYALAADAASVLSRAVGKTLQDSLRNHGGLAKLAPNMVQSLADRAINAYERSILADMRKNGAYDTSPTYNRSADHEAKLILPSYDGGIVNSANNLAHTVFGLISNAPQSAFYRLNKGRTADDRALVHHTRRLAGDIGVRGNSIADTSFIHLGNAAADAVAKGGIKLATLPAMVMRHYVPYGNVMIQGVSRHLEALQPKNLPGTLTGAFFGLGVPAFLTAMYAAQSHPDYAQYVAQQMSSPEFSAGPVIPVFNDDGVPLPPEYWPQVRIPQELRPLWFMAQTLSLDALGITSGEMYAPENDQQRKIITQIINNRDLDRLKAAMSSAMMPSVPPMIAAGANVMGARISTDHGIMPYNSRPLPGMTTAETTTLNRVRDLMSSVAGAVGDTAFRVSLEFANALRGDESVSKALERAGKQWVQSAEDRNRYANGLWGAEMRVSQDIPDNDLLFLKREALGNIKRDILTKMPEALATRVTSGAMPLDAAVNMTPMSQQDLIVAQVASRVDQMFNRAGGLGQQSNDLLRQIQAMRLDTSRDAETKRRLTNEYISRRNELSRLMLVEIMDAEAMLSRMTGQPFTFESFSPKQRTDQ